MKRGLKPHALIVLLGASVLSLAAYYSELPYVANIVIAFALLVGSAVAASRNKRLVLVVSAILCIKFLYVLDLFFAIFDERPLRWVLATSYDRVLVRSQALLLAGIWISSFTAIFTHFAVTKELGGVRRAMPLRLRPIGVCLLLVSQMAFVVIVWKAGGISNMLAAMSSRYELYFGIGFLRVVVALGAVGSALFLLAGRAPMAWTASFIVFIELAALGGRSFALLSTFVPLALVWARQRNDFPLKRVLLLGVFALVFVGLLGSYRSSQQIRQYGHATHPIVRIAMDTGGADNFPSLLLLLQREQIAFAGWKIVVAGLVAPVPRAIWANKPVADEAAAVGVILANADEVNSGLPIGPHGLAFYTGGAIAVLVFGVLSGLFASSIIALTRKSAAWAAVGPFVLLLAPDMFSPAVVARIVLLAFVALGIGIASRIKVH